mmetsp:Transcript_8433/g.11088  ORF Transcript_8433/g.11088 Transcript_8433/m.11088 type:complete len:517 (-) Transcript_8433:113-1663(-)|eukprot:CAMPEP_0198152964 /NCGR_PEP_ID=MMETSP1443-20131203/61977_1 /TAXON_ID=186043 /ORGANISM="Entomoneis sp., Strain CCMP2396" /LENGTH=516 /DNA_ID=CAMNT_0043819129 /DNA_START=131 /DNA_END=1681 /DNA_ORIENTATION=-
MPLSFTMGVDVFQDEPQKGGSGSGFRVKQDQESLDESFDSQNLHDVEDFSPSLSSPSSTMVEPSKNVTLMQHVKSTLKSKTMKYTSSSNTIPSNSNNKNSKESWKLWIRDVVVEISKFWKSINSQNKKVIALIAAVLILVFTVTSLTATPKNRGSSSSPPPSSSSAAVKGNLETFLSTVTSDAILHDPSSFQYMAWQWLEQENAWKDATKAAVPMLLERYGVLVLDMHLRTGPTRESVAKVGVSTCDWAGIQCNANSGFVETINWAGQALSGNLPQELGLFTNGLKTLDLAENEIYGTLPEGLFHCKKIQYLYLHDNALRGELSPSFGNLKNLVQLYLGLNQFRGSIPRELGDVRGPRPLRYLSLYKNDLSGPIPQDMTFKMMFYLDLSYNNFEGPLPRSWSEGEWRMRHIRNLFLNNNKFTGTIPTNYPQMGNGRMEMFHVGDNQLTGAVPGGYNPVTFMSSLELHHNNFDEPLSKEVCGLIVFLPPSSEMTNLKADCNICSCDRLCEPGYCYEK